MATFKPVVFSTENHIKADGTTNIKIRIYHNKQSQYISTPFYVEPEYMGDDGNIQNSNNSELLNFELGGLIQKYRGIALKIGTERISRMSCKDVQEQIIAAVEPDYEFIDFISFSRKVIEETSKPKTAEWYDRSLNSFIWFIGSPKIDARDVTREKIEEYIKQLSISGQGGRPLEAGGVSNYLRGLRALYNKCKSKYNKEDHNIIRIQNNPFPKKVIPAYKRKRKSITINDIKRIRDGEFSTGRANMARDVFMMMFYLMGINATDLYHLEGPRHGRIVYERKKTDTEDNIYNYALSIRIEPELQVLLDKYSDGGFLSYFKLKYSNIHNFTRAINKGLDTICEDLKLPYDITSNWARHTWASLGRNKAGIAKADIDFCLGHVNNDTKMADIYIDIDYGIFDECNRKILDLLSDLEKKLKK